MKIKNNIFKHKRVAIDFDGTLFEESKNIFKDFKNNKQLKPLVGESKTKINLKKINFEI